MTVGALASAPVNAAQDENLQKMLLSYEVLAHRATAHNGLLWQTPALALAAQAFLLTIALGPDSSTLARCLSSALAALLSLMSYQLMRKHTHLSYKDRDRLAHLEMTLQMPVWHSKDIAFGQSWVVRLASSRMWRIGLLLFAGVAATIFVTALAAPDLLEGSAQRPQPSAPESAHPAPTASPTP